MGDNNAGLVVPATWTEEEEAEQPDTEPNTVITAATPCW